MASFLPLITLRLFTLAAGGPNEEEAERSRRRIIGLERLCEG